MRRVLIAVACVVGVSAGMLFTVVFTLVCATLLVYYGAAGVLALLEQHRTVSEEMVWQCLSIQDTDNPKAPHIEMVRLWFVKNPHYEKTAGGPHLCVDLKATGLTRVTVSFRVWGNRWQGLHGYDEIGISAGSRKLDVYGFGAAPFYQDIEHPENERGLAYPDMYRNPLEVFK